MKYSLPTLILVCFVIVAQAQPINRATPATMRKVADESFERGDYYNALEWYEKSYEEAADTEIALRIAKLNYALRDYRRAESWYKRIFRRDKKNEFAEERYYLARSMKMNGNYDEAIAEFETFINETQNAQLKALAMSELTGAELAKGMEPVIGVEVKHAGRNINFYSTEASPVLDKDGQTVYFSSTPIKEIVTLDGKQGDYYIKIYKATRKEGGGWNKPEELGQEINRPGFHTGNPKFSPDGSLMYFTRAETSLTGLTSSKIYVSQQSDGSWGPARELIGANGDFIAKHPEVGELYGDEVLFFVSNMDGGYGGDDIYYAKRKSDDVFGDPINLGPTINSEGDEASPFYQDGALYFSSNGHPTAGGFDIFVSAWNGSNWSRPENMGLGYNSEVDDLYYMMDDKGLNGFLVSNREGTRSLKSKTCCDDIFEINIAPIVAQLEVYTFEGRKALIDVSIQLIEMVNNTMGNTNEKSTGEKSNQADFGLALEMPYRVIATKEGYYPDTLDFNTVGLTESTVYEKSFDLKPLPPPPPEELYETFTINEPIRLNRIYYDFDDDKILADAEPDLQIVLELMNEYSDMVIELSSHTDARGRYAYNERLSQRRAESATKWLLDRGIATERIVAKGYGETQILNQCTNGVKCTDDEHRFNRRTVFTIIAGPTEIKIERKRLKKYE